MQLAAVLGSLGRRFVRCVAGRVAVAARRRRVYPAQVYACRGNRIERHFTSALRIRYGDRLDRRISGPVLVLRGSLLDQCIAGLVSVCRGDRIERLIADPVFVLRGYRIDLHFVAAFEFIVRQVGERGEFIGQRQHTGGWLAARFIVLHRDMHAGIGKQLALRGRCSCHQGLHLLQQVAPFVGVAECNLRLKCGGLVRAGRRQRRRGGERGRGRVEIEVVRKAGVVIESQHVLGPCFRRCEHVLRLDFRYARIREYLDGIDVAG